MTYLEFQYLRNVDINEYSNEVNRERIFAFAKSVNSWFIVASQFRPFCVIDLMYTCLTNYLRKT